MKLMFKVNSCILSLGRGYIYKLTLQLVREDNTRYDEFKPAENIQGEICKNM